MQDFSPPTSPLTAREQEILRLFSHGHHGPEIAKKLFLSEHTITSYRRKLQQKLDTTSIAHSVAEALRRGYIE